MISGRLHDKRTRQITVKRGDLKFKVLSLNKTGDKTPHEPYFIYSFVDDFLT